jgi:predicted GIY-YIG superfamily endonuclease
VQGNICTININVYICKMKTYIYTLDCPITKTIKYVGKTINPKQRISQHIRCKENTKKTKIINT